MALFIGIKNLIGKNAMRLRLPGYTPLEYIESTGSQYIDTGFQPNFATRWELDNEFTALNPRGSYSGIYRNNPIMRFDIALEPGGLLLNYGLINIVNNDNSLFINERFLYILDALTLKWGYNNTTGTFPTTTFYLIQKNIFIFCRNDANGSDRFSSQKTYSSKLFDNNVLVQHLIPCKDRNGVVCMYDKVTRQFFYNQGTGDFVAGPEI